MSKYTYRNDPKTYFFNTCFDKNQLKSLISWFIKQSGEKITVDFLETLKQIGFHQATVAGVSLGLDDLEIPSQKFLLISQAKTDVSLFEQQSISGNLTSVEKSQRMISTWNQTSEILRKTAVQQFKNTNPVNPVYMMAFSGARGNISQVRQLVAMRGLMADPQGVILEFPIQSNFREGLTLTEYLISCYGARKGLVDTALRTATSGYLTRRLVDAAQHVIVSIKDCGTTQGFRIRNKDLQQHLIGRVLAKDLKINQNLSLKRNQSISPTLAKLITKNIKEAFVRSPLTCQAENSICQLCYGWNLAHGNLVSIGEAVGVIAAQSIGEPGTQLTMRTFHTGGVGVFSDQATRYFLAPVDGVIEYSEGLAGHFVRTPHGKIVYMIKNTNTFQNSILNLKDFETNEIKYSIKKHEVSAGSILLVRQGERVKAGQVVAQSSQIKKFKQKMPESTNPVFSPISGEIFFESMTILKQKKLTQDIQKQIERMKKTGKQKPLIGPDIRTLKGLGSFWVLSGQTQQEIDSAKTLLRSGDLVSSKSSLFQYDFYIRQNSIFQNISNKACLGLNALYLPIEKINFHKIAYSMLLKNHSVFSKKKNLNQKELLFFNKNKLQNVLIWFPNGSSLDISGFWLNLLMYSQIKNKNLSNLSHSSMKSIKADNNWFGGSFFYIPKYLKQAKTFSITNFNNTKFQYFVNLKNSNEFVLKNNTSLKPHSLIQSNSKIRKFQTKFFLEKRLNTRKKITLKTKSFYSIQKNYLIDSISKVDTNFLTSALNKVQSSISSNFEFSNLLVQEKKGWIYIPTKISKKSQPNRLVICEQGKIVDEMLFVNSKTCSEYISKRKIALIKSLKNNFCRNNLKNWYSAHCFLESNILTSKIQSKTNSLSTATDFIYPKATNLCTQEKNKKFFKVYLKSFLYYKLQKLPINLQNKNTSNFSETISPSNFLASIKSKQNGQKVPSFFLFIHSLKEFTLPKKQDLIKQWGSIKKFENNFSTNSYLFTKQKVTEYKKHEKLTKKFQLRVSDSGRWFSEKNIFKLLINLNSQKLFKRVNGSYLISQNLKTYKVPILGVHLFLYNFLSIPENSSFFFQVFENNWVLSSNKISTGFIKIRKYGEFRSFKSKTTKSIICILTSQDLLKVNLDKFITNTSTKTTFSKNKQIRIGHVFRSGTEIFPGITTSTSGYILNKNFNTFTIRLGIPFLASARGIIHVSQNDLIQTNDLLVTLKSRRLQTEDIVQGIPKIEQLFEARQTQGGTLIRNSVHRRLKKYFISSLKSKKGSTTSIHTSLSFAVTDSLEKIQFYLVQSILQAYSTQGVNISQKHIEIIVRQMTTRVRILSGGDSGLLPGELIQFTRIQKINKQLYSCHKRPALYEPIILGITKSVFQSESFLLSASFQEVSRVLVRSALTKKRDFLRGLHENVILGQLVPTGTGLVETNKKK